MNDGNRTIIKSVKRRTNHLQTILNCAEEPITLAQHVLESVFKLSLIKEGCGMTVQMLTMSATNFLLR